MGGVLRYQGFMTQHRASFRKRGIPFLTIFLMIGVTRLAALDLVWGPEGTGGGVGGGEVAAINEVDPMLARAAEVPREEGDGKNSCLAGRPNSKLSSGWAGSIRLFRLRNL